MAKLNLEPRFDLSNHLVSSIEGSGLQTHIGFLQNISAGSEDESDQTLYFNTTLESVTSNLFEKEPFVNRNGTLFFSLANSGYGSATVAIKLTDSGGTEYGGIDHTVSLN